MTGWAFNHYAPARDDYEYEPVAADYEHEPATGCPKCGCDTFSEEEGYPYDRRGRTLAYWVCDDCGWQAPGSKPGSGVL